MPVQLDAAEKKLGGLKGGGAKLVTKEERMAVEKVRPSPCHAPGTAPALQLSTSRACAMEL